ncbi:FAD-dependent oxidoreductase [Thermostilla marina]
MGKKRVLIVGGVAGGAACAARLRRLDEDAEIFIFERGENVSFANCGMPYYIGGVIPNRRSLLVATPERFRDWFNIEVRVRHEVMSIDRRAKSVRVRNVASGVESTETYDALVLSPGARPIVPPVPGVETPGVFTLRNLNDADRIYGYLKEKSVTRAVVVGGGYVGLEMAENLVARNVTVTVVEAADQLMNPLDPEMASFVATALESRDVEYRLNDPLSAIEENAASGLTVRTQSGGRIPAGIVILAVGVKPEVDLAVEAGLELGELGGIKVDEQMRTSDPAIFAVGDAVEVRHVVSGRPSLVPLAGPAGRQGRVAAEVIAGRDSRYGGVLGTAVLGLFNSMFAATGLNEKTLRASEMPYRKSYTVSASHAGYYPGASPIVTKLLFSPDDGRILGAQAIGSDGVDKRIDVIAALIRKGGTVFDLEEAELCYAPQFGSARDPANIAGSVAANLLRGDVQEAHWEALPDALRSDTPPVVVDVRTPGEFEAGHVPEAINIPLGELRDRFDELPRDRQIWVHCGVGQRSYYAARILKQKGFDVRNLSGGFRLYQAWRKAEMIK